MQRYFSKTKNGEYFELSNDDIRHIKTVMRMKDGDNIEVVYNRKIYLCCISNVNKNVNIKLLKEYENSISFIPKTRLIIPFLKENKLDFIFQKSTEMGVDSIILVPMERSIIRLNNKDINKKIDRWMRIVKEASEQSMRNTIPHIEVMNSISDIINMSGLNVICSTSEKKNNIKKMFQMHRNCDTINLVIGPEGGISSKEEKYLTDNGFSKITLGDRIMRVETVPLFLMSVINYEFME